MKYLEMAAKDIADLIEDVSLGFHIPKKFRKSPFTLELQQTYVKYLLKEQTKLVQKMRKIQ